jgi:hypothetical protein
LPCFQRREGDSPILPDRIALSGKIAGNGTIARVNLALLSTKRVRFTDPAGSDRTLAMVFTEE